MELSFPTVLTNYPIQKYWTFKQHTLVCNISGSAAKQQKRRTVDCAALMEITKMEWLQLKLKEMSLKCFSEFAQQGGNEPAISGNTYQISSWKHDSLFPCLHN